MPKKSVFIKTVPIIILGVFFIVTSAFSEENTEELKNQVETLNLKVKELEKQLESKNSLPEDYLKYPFVGPGAGHWKGSQLRPWDVKDFNSNWIVVPESKEGKLISEISRMQEEVNRMFQDSFNQKGWPKSGILNSSIFYDEKFDLEKTDEGYMIKLDIKGMDKENIDVEANEKAVTISGEYFKQVEESNPYKIYSLNGYGSFLKTVPLPEDADAKKLETIKEEDNLIIKIPKK